MIDRVGLCQWLLVVLYNGNREDDYGVLEEGNLFEV